MHLHLKLCYIPVQSQIVAPLAMHTVPGHVGPADEDLPFASAPVVCQLCHCGFAGFDALLVHCRKKHGNWVEYRKQLFFHAREAGLQPIRSWTKRAMIRNFSFFQSFSVPSSLNDWSRKTLTHCQPRRLEACVICAVSNTNPNIPNIVVH